MQSRFPSIDIEQHASTRVFAKLQLPDPPSCETGPVRAWEQPVVMRTWMPAAPDRNPLFLEKRVYQGSSGCVYPLPVIDRIETEPQDRAWQAVHLENRYLRVMVLPEIGGRIHVGLDKLNGYDFFYRQNVIKPALVGLAGPWISGGVEFNWPQHHRPATFMPVQVAIERHSDGAITVWCGDHDPMTRMKGMHGLCLHPDKAYLELRVRLYNRTAETRTFLWWANVAARVHEKYQAFFPPDVRFVADHAKRAVTEFPLSRGEYYGIDYGRRAVGGIRPEEMPRRFAPDGSYAPNDLRWYANIPVPTSYMIAASRGDFFGGYDHAQQAGFVHFADHRIAPGKKQWTWGNHEFGYAWERSLTESDGPYVELMAGVYTDNQPDFSFLAPGETKAFQQFWYPIREIGAPDEANLDAALRVERLTGGIRIHLQVTTPRSGCTVRLRVDGADRGVWQGDLCPELPLHHTFDAVDGHLEVRLEQAGRTLLRYAPGECIPQDRPTVATEPPSPPEVGSNDELFLIGLHLEQYRHPTRSPEIYWQEALRRDARDSRANHALGRWHMQRGEFAAAEQHLRAAITRLTGRNPNPSDGEPYYTLGLALNYLGRREEACDAFYKSTWNAAWRGPAYHRLAEIDCARRQWTAALDHLDRSLRADADNLSARNLKAVVLWNLGREQEAEELLGATCALDRLDVFSRFLAAGALPPDGQQSIDLSFDLLRAGLFDRALTVASAAPQSQASDGAATLLLYVRAHVLKCLGRAEESAAAYRQAALADFAYVFPGRLEEMLLLEEAIANNPRDARAHYYLGNLLYGRRRHGEAIAHWELAVQLEPGIATAWRNLGIGCFNVLRDARRASEAFAHARALAPDDARILYEQDQLAKRTGKPIEHRLAALEASRELVERRDDLSVELATLYNNAGKPESALALLLSRAFQPWEGGEGLVLAEYIRAHLLLGQRALGGADPAAALHHFQAAQSPPEGLGEAAHPLLNLSAIDYWLGAAYAASGSAERAADHWQRAARTHGDFLAMKVQSISAMSYWSAMSLRRLGREEDARALLREIYDHAVKLNEQTPSIDYFATSLPAMLLFDEDLKQRQTVTACFLRAQALLGLGERQRAAALLDDVLKVDRSHSGAIDLLRMEGCQ